MVFPLPGGVFLEVSRLPNLPNAARKGKVLKSQQRFNLCKLNFDELSFHFRSRSLDKLCLHVIQALLRLFQQSASRGRALMRFAFDDYGLFLRQKVKLTKARLY
jgi:hypothetical protein